MPKDGILVRGARKLKQRFSGTAAKNARNKISAKKKLEAAKNPKYRPNPDANKARPKVTSSAPAKKVVKKATPKKAAAAPRKKVASVGSIKKASLVKAKSNISTSTDKLKAPKKRSYAEQAASKKAGKKSAKAAKKEGRQTERATKKAGRKLTRANKVARKSHVAASKGNINRAARLEKKAKKIVKK